MRAKPITAALFTTILISACGPAGQQETRNNQTGPVVEPRSEEVADLEKGSIHTVRPSSQPAPAYKARQGTPYVGYTAGATVVAEADKSYGMPYIIHPPHPIPQVDREKYANFDDNPLQRAAESPVSTFSIDVDTGSYTNVRRILGSGQLPPVDAVRVEEMINYFSYSDQAATDSKVPFRFSTEMGASPWNPKSHLLRIGIKAWAPVKKEMPAANLVFLVDVSGSMQAQNKLPLLKRSLRLLSRQLDGDDRITIVVYAGASGVVLEPTPGNKLATIEQALEQLSAGGSTHGSAGIKLAYAKAREAFIPDGINRVLLATDGDFNVGTVNHDALIDIIEQQRKHGIALTTLGFGDGNYNDQLMEQLADHGNGNYAYIDSLMEARKVLVEELGSTLQTVAKDVKIQIEFNPEVVAEYRLIGYENRVLAREDFNNDKVDAGEIGAGHSVSALYEVTLAGSGGERVDPLRYGKSKPAPAAHSGEVATMRLRYKLPKEDHSKLVETTVLKESIVKNLQQNSDDYRFAAAVAAFGQTLRGGKYLEQFGYDEIISLARGSLGSDAGGYRSELVRLVALARDLGPVASTDQPMERAVAGGR
jgi:Ca-activated chloride channel family protein